MKHHTLHYVINDKVEYGIIEVNNFTTLIEIQSR